jgi:hypothetical protein
MMRARGRAVGARLMGLAAAWLATATLTAPSAAAHVHGSFAPTGDMTVGRIYAAAAPLADGRVLVAGGADQSIDTGDNVLQSAEIYDPRTGTFSPTGSMTVPRVGAAAAPLPDGRVLVVGGDDKIQLAGALKSAEIFDPATGSFTPTGDMTITRNQPAAAPLPDGRVLVAGGTYRDPISQVYLASAEIYDPAAGTFSPTGSMAVRRVGAAAAPLPGGRTLVAGGAFPSAASAEIYDSSTGRFASVGDAITGPRGAAASLPDGRVLIAGGDQYGPSSRIFDPVTATYASTDYKTTTGYDVVAAPLPDGRVLVAGPRRSAELFTPDFFYRLDGRKLTVSEAVAGTLTLAAARSRPGASAAGRSRPPLKSTRREGGPGLISFKLTPLGKAQRRLQRRGKVNVRVSLRFVPKPVNGNCVTEVSPCFTSGYSISQTVALTLKAKRRSRAFLPYSAGS